jgi:hypothetical protein
MVLNVSNSRPLRPWGPLAWWFGQTHAPVPVLSSPFESAWCVCGLELELLCNGFIVRRPQVELPRSPPLPCPPAPSPPPPPSPSPPARSLRRRLCHVLLGHIAPRLCFYAAGSALPRNTGLCCTIKHCAWFVLWLVVFETFVKCCSLSTQPNHWLTPAALPSWDCGVEFDTIRPTSHPGQ